MHAGTRPGADRRLPCPGVTIPAGKQSEDISTVTTLAKGLPYLADRKFFGKAPPLALYWQLAKNPKIQQKAARQNFQTLPAPFEGNVSSPGMLNRGQL
jgi:hypothetical protein